MPLNGIESLPYTQMFNFLYLLNLMVYTFDISNQNSKFEISKVYDIGF